MGADKPFNFERLRLLRESLGISQTEFARRLRITQAALSKLESGNLVPSDDLLKDISEEFGYCVEYFQKESQILPCGLVFHRKRASLPAKIRSRLEAEAKLRALDVLKIREYADFSSNLIRRDGQTPEECARRLRKLWKVGANCPIDNLVELCEKNGVLILSFDFGTDKIDGFFLSLSDSNVTFIFINDSEVFSPDRRRFSLAHELGHAVLHCDEFPSLEAEEEANNFASEFLAPKAGIAPEIRIICRGRKSISLKDLFALKRKWKISMAAILYRAKSLGLIDEKAYRRLCVYMSAQGYRKQEPPAGLAIERPKGLTRLFAECSQQAGASVRELLALPDDTFERRYGFCQSDGGKMSR